MAHKCSWRREDKSLPSQNICGAVHGCMKFPMVPSPGTKAVDSGCGCSGSGLNYRGTLDSFRLHIEFQVDHPRPTFQVFGTSFVRRVFVGHLIILFDCYETTHCPQVQFSPHEIAPTQSTGSVHAAQVLCRTRLRDPVEKASPSYQARRSIFEAVVSLIGNLSHHDKHEMYHKTAEECYWTLSTSAGSGRPSW